MTLLLDSFWRAAAYCMHPRVIALSFLPLVIMVALALGLGYFYWDPALEWVRVTLESSAWITRLWGWLEGLGAGKLKTVLAPLIVIFAVTPVIVLVALLIVAALMTPALVALVAERRFPHLERKRGGSLLVSLLWSAGSTLLALVALIVSLPLWLVPPLILILPPLIWGWLTYRVMSFDVLADHASKAERVALIREHRGWLLGIGILTGYLGAAPSVVWASGTLFAAAFVILAPVAIWIYTLVFAFSSLWFAHYGLAALEKLRATQGTPPAPGSILEPLALGDEPSAPNPPPQLRPLSPLPPESVGTFGLIVIGDEILSGKRTDKHLPKIIELLGARGLSLGWAEYVGDSPARITAALQRAFASGDVVFSTGGIGATPDDHTRQCAARALGVDLVLHPEAAALILERMQDIAREQGKPYEPERPDNAHRLNMGVFPAGAQIIPNPYNKIPGFSCYPPRPDMSAAGPPQGAKAPAGGSEPHAVGERGGDMSAAGPPQGAKAPAWGSEPHTVGERGGIHFVPGFPVMAWPMVEWVLDTLYPHRFTTGAWVEQSVIVFGAIEATLTPLMEAIEREHPGIRVFSLPSVDHPEYGRHIELGVKGAPAGVAPAWVTLLQGLKAFDVKLGPELVRNQ